MWDCKISRIRSQEALEKKLGCKVSRFSTSIEGYDADYEAGEIETSANLKTVNYKQKIKRTIRQNRKIGG